MKRAMGLIAILVLSLVISGCGKGKESATHKEGTKHEEKAAGGVQKPEEAKKAGDSLKAQALITAFIEDAGKKVNVVATSAADGKVVFNEILVDWNYEKSTQKEAAAGAAPAGG